MPSIHSPVTDDSDDIDARHKRRGFRSVAYNRSMEVVLRNFSLLLWVPYTVGAAYVAYCSCFRCDAQGSHLTPSSLPADNAADGFELLAFIPLITRIALFSAAAMGSSYFLVVHLENGGGEGLMALAWIIGLLSETEWLTSDLTANPHFVEPPSSLLSMTLAPSSETSACGAPQVPGWLWLVVSMLTGLLSGVLCKVKDVMEGKQDRDTQLFRLFEQRDSSPMMRRRLSGSRGNAKGMTERSPAVSETFVDSDEAEDVGADSQRTKNKHHPRRRRSAQRWKIGLGERLYVVVPLCTGQWLSFILRHGWKGIVIQNSLIVLSLGMIGYTMLSYKLLVRQILRVASTSHRPARRRGAPIPASAASRDTAGQSLDEIDDGPVVDVIELISKLLTTSFGVVVLAIVGLNAFLTSLVIPFLKALFSLNALVSSAGIVVELIIYDLV